MMQPSVKAGTGVVANVAGKVSVIGKVLGPLLQKIGLGAKDINKIKRGGCVCQDGIQVQRYGNGLYLGPQGRGVF